MLAWEREDNVEKDGQGIASKSKGEPNEWRHGRQGASRAALRGEWVMG